MQASALWSSAGRFPILVARYRMARDTGNDRLVKNHDVFFLSEATMEDANPQLILERGEATHCRRLC